AHENMQRITTLLASVALFVATGALAAAADDSLYMHPGKRISIGRFALNVYCQGSGTPTVVFDAGWGDWSAAWSIVQPQIARRTRACSFDRAGYGFSAPGAMPRT